MTEMNDWLHSLTAQSTDCCTSWLTKAWEGHNMHMSDWNFQIPCDKNCCSKHQILFTHAWESGHETVQICVPDSLYTCLRVWTRDCKNLCIRCLVDMVAWGFHGNMVYVMVLYEWYTLQLSNYFTENIKLNCTLWVCKLYVQQKPMVLWRIYITVK